MVHKCKNNNVVSKIIQCCELPHRRGVGGQTEISMTVQRCSGAPGRAVEGQASVRTSFEGLPIMGPLANPRPRQLYTHFFILIDQLTIGQREVRRDGAGPGERGTMPAFSAKVTISVPAATAETMFYNAARASAIRGRGRLYGDMTSYRDDQRLRRSDIVAYEH
ncbi:hypothetical protein EVAR_24137_1 [Eumeta japonica]|uniref:Uncharacterized protein n=1 Tax=Eumeta variegata TaxID=151549 RepID=A0A4C1YQJ1_EUMVA|nr:hypothetical protein EVAR_24137_1 [Eumeta japonica]